MGELNLFRAARIAAYYQDAAMLYELDKFWEWDVAKPVKYG